MQTIRTLIVDDEPASRASVRLLLRQHRDIQLIGECETGAQVAPAMQDLQPDLVFLDINLPEQNGMAALRAIPPERRPVIVFVTAYQEHAVNAFELEAADYLLKPYSDSRFGDALARARKRLDFLRSGDSALRNTEGPAVARNENLAIRSANSVKLVPMTDIDWIEAAGDYVRVYATSTSHLMRSTMAALERRLDPARFVRIHRCTIINVSFLTEIRGLPNGDSEVVLRSGVRRRLSESGRAELERVLRIRL